MAVSEVTICSNALLMLGDSPISSFEEGTNRARLAANLWAPVRDMVLRLHPWNCAIKRQVLAPDSTAPAFDWDHQFTLPDDCLRVLSVGRDGDGTEWAVESGKLLCDENPVYLRYVWRNTQPTRWDSALVWAMTIAMRAVFSQPVSASTSLEQLIGDALKDILKQARAADGQEDPPQQLGLERLYAARMGG